MLTVLLSAFNEAENPFFWKTIETIHLLKNQGFKINMVAGVTPGHDATLSLLDKYQVQFVEVESSKRAQRFNRAYELSTGGKDDWIILNHPRSFLEVDAFLALPKLSSHHKWGAFTHQFDMQHPLLSFTSWWSNCVRGDIKNIYYLDHCLFIRRSLFEKVGGFPDREIFEDTILSQDLSAFHRPLRLPWKSTTSAIRFRNKGIFKQSFQNQVLKCQFMLNFDDVKMNRQYEKDLDLNTTSQE